MREGLFWVIGSSEDWTLLPVFVPSNVISHEEAWKIHIQPSEKRFRQIAYNFYPGAGWSFATAGRRCSLTSISPPGKWFKKSARPFPSWHPEFTPRVVVIISVSWTGNERTEQYGASGRIYANPKRTAPEPLPQNRLVEASMALGQGYDLRG